MEMFKILDFPYYFLKSLFSQLHGPDFRQGFVPRFGLI